MANQTIDPSKVKWDSTQIDPTKVKWDAPVATPANFAQQASQMPSGQLQVPQIPVNPGTGFGMPTMNAINANSLLGPEANKTAIAANIANQAKANAIPIEAQQAAAVKIASLPAQKEETVNTQRAQAIANIPAALRDLDVMKEQFNQAFPVGDNTQPWYQRIKGALAGLGANTGIGTNPQQVAVLKAMPLATIGLVRMAGALGRVTNFEIAKAEQVVNEAGLTEPERFEMTRTLATQYLSRLDTDDWKVLVKQSPDLPNVMNDLGIKSKIIDRAMGKNVKDQAVNLQSLKSKYGLK